MLRDISIILIVVFLFVFEMSCLSKMNGNNKEQELTASDIHTENSPSTGTMNYAEDIKEVTKPVTLEAVDYVSYIESETSGLLKDTTAGDITFSIQYKPYIYIAIKNLKTPKPLEKELKKEVKQMNELQYFNFKIAMEDAAELKARLQEQENYFNFYMQQDLKLIENKDTLSCVLYHFERNYVAPYVTFVLGFELSKEEMSAIKKSDADYKYRDKIFFLRNKVFSTGNISFSIKGKDINELPSLKYN